jgi:hypothetical protein
MKTSYSFKSRGNVASMVRLAILLRATASPRAVAIRFAKIR